MSRSLWRQKLARLKSSLWVVYLAYRHPKTPRLARVVAMVAIMYAASPIDLIPDFIPVLGHIDDIFLVPALIWIAVKLIPPEIWRECQTEAEKSPPDFSDIHYTIVPVIVFWVLVIAFGAIVFYRIWQ